jgi:hypothetical protein
MTRQMHRVFDIALLYESYGQMLFALTKQMNKRKSTRFSLWRRSIGQVNRVVVWLGEAADDSNRAVEEIRAAAGKKSTNCSNNESIQQAILALFQRPWFRCIWVREQTLELTLAVAANEQHTRKGHKQGTSLYRYVHRRRWKAEQVQ